MDAFDRYQALLAPQPEQYVKTAGEIQWENAYWDEMAKQAATYENQQISELFNWAFNDHMDKLAAADPAFAQLLIEDEIKAAFNQGYNEAA